MKKLLSILIAVSMVLTASAAFAEGEDIRVFLDNRRLNFTDANGDEVLPMVIDGTTYLPLRAIANSLGIGVRWSEAERRIDLFKGGDEIVATEVVYSNLGYYASNPYELLGKSAFLDPIEKMTGKDYDALVGEMATTYAKGNAHMLSLYCSDKAVIDVYETGRIDIVRLSPKDKEYDEANVFKYYSNVSPDAVDSPGIVDFITVYATDKDYSAINFVNGNDLPASLVGNYSDVNGFGGFTFLRGDGTGVYRFMGTISGSPRGGCNTSGNITSVKGSALCVENNSPSILMAFSGDSLTIIGLNDVTKALTSVYEK